MLGHVFIYNVFNERKHRTWFKTWCYHKDLRALQISCGHRSKEMPVNQNFVSVSITSCVAILVLPELICSLSELCCRLHVVIFTAAFPRSVLKDFWAGALFLLSTPPGRLRCFGSEMKKKLHGRAMIGKHWYLEMRILFIFLSISTVEFLFCQLYIGKWFPYEMYIYFVNLKYYVNSVSSMLFL